MGGHADRHGLLRLMENLLEQYRGETLFWIGSIGNFFDFIAILLDPRMKLIFTSMFLAATLLFGLSGCVEIKSGILDDYFSTPYRKIIWKQRLGEQIKTTIYTIDPKNKHKYISNDLSNKNEYWGLVPMETLALPLRYKTQRRQEYLAVVCGQKSQYCNYFEVDFDLDLGAATAQLIEPEKLLNKLIEKTCPSGNEKFSCEKKASSALKGVLVTKKVLGYEVSATSIEGVRNLIHFARDNQDVYSEMVNILNVE